MGKQKVRVRAWRDLHFKRLASLLRTVLCIEFLKENGTPRYKRPIWLFWTGSYDVTLQDLCHMYLWRFAKVVCSVTIEHLFRFLKISSAAFGFGLFVAVWYSSSKHQTRRKRCWQTKRLSTGSQITVGRGVQV
ncbi:MAG: hypothetical protein WCA79_20955 [Anaerolineales bacterium]